MATEIRLKEWLTVEALRLGITPVGVFRRLGRGKYPGLKVRRVNRRLVFVTVPDEALNGRPPLASRASTCECGNPRAAQATGCPRCRVIEKRLATYSNQPNPYIGCPRCRVIEKRLATYSNQPNPYKSVAARGLPEYALHLGAE